MMRLSKIILIVLSVFMFSSCQKGKEMRTQSGMKYILYTENKGKKAEAGDYVSIDLVYKNENDSVLYDSRETKSLLRFELRKPQFEGSLEEGLTELVPGDSATFFVSADSMKKYVFKGEDMDKAKTSSLRQGSFLKMDVKMLRVQSAVEAEQDIVINQINQEKAEKEKLQKYLSDKNISRQPDTLGIYIIKQSEGKGTAVENGFVVSINYEGSFLDGKIFNTNKGKGPYSFVVGNRDVIRGWDIAFRTMKLGDKATLIIPSKLAYGAEGLRNPQTLEYIVPPHSTLVFDVEVVSVSKVTGEPLSKK